VSNFLLAVLFMISEILEYYFWIVIIAVIISWIPLSSYSPIARMISMILRNLTEPVFSYLRQKLGLNRYTTPLDFTPIIVIIAIRLIQNVIIRNLAELVSQLRYL
jgi:YggT family protein